MFQSVEKREFYSHPKNISWNQLFSNFFSRNIAFMIFLLNVCESNFPWIIHNCFDIKSERQKNYKICTLWNLTFHNTESISRKIWCLMQFSRYSISKECSIVTVWKWWKITLTLFPQKFRESNVFNKEVTNELISRKNFSVKVNFTFFHTAIEQPINTEILRFQEFTWTEAMWLRTC